VSIDSIAQGFREQQLLGSCRGGPDVRVILRCPGCGEAGRRRCTVSLARAYHSEFPKRGGATEDLPARLPKPRREDDGHTGAAVARLAVVHGGRKGDLRIAV